MREDIGLFRGKRIDSSAWVSGNLWRYSSDGKTYILHESGTPIEVDLATIGEYTGLKDKDGKRIFEGDVVEMLYDDEYSEVGEIVWSADLARYMFSQYDGILLRYYSIDATCKMEWLATIHDNPELLEV